MKFTYDGVSAHIQIAMQMSPCKDGDAKCLVVQMPSNGYVMMQMLLVGCHDANVSLVHAMMRISTWEYAYDANTIYKKFPLFSKRGFLSA